MGAWLLALIFVPILSRAESVDLPALGLTIQDLPVNATRPQVTALGDGVRATVQVGTASLSISRLADPLLAGDVRDPQFRKAQAVYFREDPKAYGAASSISGHDAWTSYLQSDLGGGQFTYFVESRVIVDQHLYAISVRAADGPERPADFDAAVKMMAHLSFTPADEAAVRSLGTPAGLLYMPPSRPMPVLAWYTWNGGTVDLEFSIDGRGRVRDVKDIYASSRDLIGQAEAQFHHAVYNVDPAWESKGYDKLRFVVEFHFAVRKRCPGPDPVATHDARAQDTVVVCKTGF